jgi:hypothetical protein
MGLDKRKNDLVFSISEQDTRKVAPIVLMLIGQSERMKTGYMIQIWKIGGDYEINI